MGEFQATTDDRSQQEPSMEDILASIRRILSEDVEELQSSPKGITVEQMHAPEPFSEPEPLSELELDFEEEEAVEEEPMFQPVFEEPVPEELNADNPDSEEENVLELTDDMLVADEALAMVVDPSPLPPCLHEELELTPELEDEEEGLLSAPTAALSAAALGELVRKARERNVPLRHDHDDVTLESLVREVLRSLLKAWLDENLPSIVERVVAKEVERLAHKVEDNQW